LHVQFAERPFLDARVDGPLYVAQPPRQDQQQEIVAAPPPAQAQPPPAEPAGQVDPADEMDANVEDDMEGALEGEFLGLELCFPHFQFKKKISDRDEGPIVRRCSKRDVISLHFTDIADVCNRPRS
jgi:hypothetical protein